MKELSRGVISEPRIIGVKNDYVIVFDPTDRKITTQDIDKAVSLIIGPHVCNHKRGLNVEEHLENQPTMGD